MISALTTFLQNDIWHIRHEALPWWKNTPLKFLRVLLISFQKFHDDNCFLTASGLTFYSLLSIVPVLAAGLGISRGFGLEAKVEGLLREGFQGQEIVLDQLILFARSALEQAQGGVITGVGVVLLFYAVVRLLSLVEVSFNHIWKVIRARSPVRKFADYLAMIIICPFFFALSSSLAVYLASQIREAGVENGLVETMSPPLLWMLRLIRVNITWLLFIFVYWVMPNTRVKFWGALIGGMVAGSLYQMAQWIYIKFQIGVASYGAIYGSFAAIPLFLIWMQVSWIIVLVGAEVCYSSEHEEEGRYRLHRVRISHRFKQYLALILTRYFVQPFCAGDPPPTQRQAAKDLDVPIPLVREVVQELVDVRILSETGRGYKGQFTYQPALDPSKLTPRFVLDALDRHGVNKIPIGETEHKRLIKTLLQSQKKVWDESPLNASLTNR